MKVQIEELSPIKKKLSFELPQDALKKVLDRAYQKLNQKVSIKGFRKGKVPRSILEKHYGAQTHMEAVNELLDKAYRDAIQEHEIIAVDLPKISELKLEDHQPLTFIAEVEIQPKIVTKDFEGMTLEKDPLEIKPEEMDAELQALQKSQAQRHPVESVEPAQEGHFANINYSGTIDAIPFDGSAAQNVVLQLGSGRFLPDFERGILGMKKGETKEIEVRFPEDYAHEPLRGKTAKFKIDLIELKKEVLPTLDDEFAKDLGSFETLEQVKNQIKEHLLKTKESQGRGKLFQQILTHLISKNTFEIPSAMIERELDFMLQTVQNQLTQQGLNFEKVGLQPEDYRTKNREEAIRRIKGFLLFDSIASQNQLEVKEEEFNRRLEEIAGRYQQPVQTIQKYYQEKGLMRSLYNQILEEKTLDFLISKSTLVEKNSKGGKS